MHELLDLDIEEVSAVDLPANKRTFLVIKRASATEGQPTDVSQPVADALATLDKAGAVMASHRRQRLQDAIGALQAILAEAMPADEDPLMMEKGQTMADTGVAVVEGNVAQDQIDTLRKRAETAEARVQELEPLMAQVADLQKQLTQQVVELAKAKQTPEEQEAEWHASLPESVRKRLEADQLEIVALKKANQDIAERDARTQFIQKTAAFRNLGMTQDNWPILKAIDGMPEEPREQLLHLLTAATEQLRTSTLFKSVGFQEADPAGASNGASAEAELMRLTKAYQAEHHCDQSTAQNAVMDHHPDVYHRYVNEKRRVTRVASE